MSGLLNEANYIYGSMSNYRKHAIIISFCAVMAGYFFYQYINHSAATTEKEVLYIEGALENYNYYKKLSGKTSSWNVMLKNFKCEFEIPVKYFDGFYRMKLENEVQQNDRLTIGVTRSDGLRLQQKDETVKALSITKGEDIVVLDLQKVLAAEQRDRNINLYISLGFVGTILMMLVLIKLQ